jgi:plastocyanin
MNNTEVVRKLIVAPLLLLAGCGSSSPPASQELPSAKIDTTTGAIISGKVVLTGKAPEMPVLDMSANPACQRSNKTPRRAEEVVVNPNGTLRNTFVWLKTGLPPGRWSPPAEMAKLDQHGCVYEPHVLGIMVGQPLEISNGDTVNHNVHAESSTNAGWSEMEPPRAEKSIRRFEKEEVMFPVTCGVHAWMRSYIGVASHPFFFVTGDDGTFTLKGVPPGSYTVEAVHERYGRQEMKVTVGPRESKDVDFRYDAGASQ